MSGSFASAYLRLPAQLGAYELTDRLGAGGMGVVYRGSAPGGGEVAVKVIREEVTSAEETQRRFLREARAAARLDHPNIAQLWDFGRAEGLSYLVMELVPGVQLSTWRKSPPPGEQILPVCFQILDALAYAHARGIVHRDLKPENILIFDRPGAAPLVKLMDFGVAHLRHDASAPAAAEEAGFVGTPAYMSPEQARRAASVTPASDLYAFGILLYEMLAGYLPFRERSVAATLLAQIHAPPPDLVMRPGYAIAGPLKVTVERLLRKRPSDRFMYAADVTAALSQCTVVGQPQPVTPPEMGPLPAAPAPAVAAPPDAVPDEEEEEIHFTLQVSHFGTLAESAPAIASLDAASEPEAQPLRTADPIPAPIAAIFARAWNEPAPGLPLMAAEPSSSVAALRETPLVGRIGELARIKTLAAAACRKQRGAACLLLGEPGMGKSRLLRAAREALEQSGVMQVWNIESPAGDVAGRGAMLALLSSALGLVATPPEDWAEHLAALYPERDRHAWNANQLARLLSEAGDQPSAFEEAEEFRLFAWVLRKASAHRPVCLAIDDLHLRDGYLARLLDTLLRDHRDSAAWFFLGTLDHERMMERAGATWQPMLQSYPSRGMLDLVRLQPLREDDAVRWAQSVLPGQAAVARMVAERGDGNPRIIAALIRHQLERGATGDASELPPEALRHLLSERILRLQSAGRLSPEALDLGTLIAMLGGPVPFDLLVADHRAQVSAADQLSLAEALQELLDTELLQEPEPDLFRFDSPALRELFADQAGPRRASFHRRAAAAMLAHFGADHPGRAADLATHLLASHQHDLAVKQLLLAARHQARARNFERVRALSEQALKAIEESAFPDVEPVESWRVAARSLLLESLVQTGEHAAAKALGRTLIPETGDGSELQRRALRTLAESALQSSAPREARTLLELCLGSAERAGDEEGRLHILLSLGGLELHESQLDAAREWLARAIVQAQQFDHLLPRVLLEAARAAQLADDWDEVEAAASEAERRARAAGDPVTVAAAQRLLAERELALGAFHRAEALLGAASDAFAVTGSRQQAAQVLGIQARLEEARGNSAAAFVLHAEAESAFIVLGNRSAAAIARAEQALLAAREANWPLAAQLAASALREDAEQRVDHYRFVRLMGELALLALDAEQESLAASLLMPTYQKLQRIGVLPVLQPLTRAIAQRIAATTPAGSPP